MSVLLDAAEALDVSDPDTATSVPTQVMNDATATPIRLVNSLLTFNSPK
jgi:hypothetical protein